jgi:hypothetical protein
MKTKEVEEKTFGQRQIKAAKNAQVREKLPLLSLKN